MPKNWAVVVVATVVVLFIWTVWQVYAMFRVEPEIEQYSTYLTPVSNEFDTELLTQIHELRQKILVSEEDIAPE